MSTTRFRIALVFVLGLAAGGVAVRLASATPAVAQMAPSAPAATAMPMGGMTGQPMMRMMSPKSRADRAYMGAMMQMHGGMMRATLTGDADHDFLAMMIPHHEAAVAMAQTELQYGHDAKVKALAKRIISAQRSEIREMHSWLK
ncbi:MAG: DUF305 domain-containing protein [Candidatus Baltobacteraceae bacterium]